MYDVMAIDQRAVLDLVYAFAVSHSHWRGYHFARVTIGDSVGFTHSRFRRHGRRPIAADHRQQHERDARPTQHDPHSDSRLTEGAKPVSGRKVGQVTISALSNA